MSREILVLWVHRHRRPEWEAPIDEYLTKIRRMQAVRDVPIKVRLGGDDPRRQVAEVAAVEKALPDPCWTVLLDERGRSLSSPDFARRLKSRFDSWPHPIAYLVGSDLGWPKEFRQRANEIVSFGPMTLRHELARLVLYEQLYRALCISSGIKYHRPPL